MVKRCRKSNALSEVPTSSTNLHQEDFVNVMNAKSRDLAALFAVTTYQLVSIRYIEYQKTGKDIQSNKDVR